MSLNFGLGEFQPDCCCDGGLPTGTCNLCINNIAPGGYQLDIAGFVDGFCGCSTYNGSWILPPEGPICVGSFECCYSTLLPPNNCAVPNGSAIITINTTGAIIDIFWGPGPAHAVFFHTWAIPGDCFVAGGAGSLISGGVDCNTSGATVTISSL